jgi:hypothetical protein
MQLSEVKEGTYGIAVKFTVALGLRITRVEHTWVGGRGADISIRFMEVKGKVFTFARDRISVV